jgi:hypothetical protein
MYLCRATPHLTVRRHRTSSPLVPYGVSTTVLKRARLPSHAFSEADRLRQLEEENGKLKRIVADLSLGKATLQDVLSKKL